MDCFIILTFYSTGGLEITISAMTAEITSPKLTSSEEVIKKDRLIDQTKVHRYHPKQKMRMATPKAVATACRARGEKRLGLRWSRNQKAAVRPSSWHATKFTCQRGKRGQRGQKQSQRL